VADEIGPGQLAQSERKDIVEEIAFVDRGKGPPVRDFRPEQAVPALGPAGDAGQLKEVGRDQEEVGGPREHVDEGLDVHPPDSDEQRRQAEADAQEPAPVASLPRRGSFAIPLDAHRTQTKVRNGTSGT
jgi:hypothetical protein